MSSLTKYKNINDIKKKIEEGKKKNKILNVETLRLNNSPKKILEGWVVKNGIYGEKDNVNSLLDYLKLSNQKVNDTTSKVDTKKKQKESDVIKCSEEKKEKCEELGKSCNPKTGRCVKKLETSDVIKCSEETKEKCEKLGKSCNPKTGRCVKKLETSDVIKCSEEKKEKCKKLGKSCNPKTGRCVKKEKKEKKKVMKIYF